MHHQADENDQKTFQNSCCQYSQLMEITDIVILNEI